METSDALQWLESTYKITADKTGLQRITRLCQLMDTPQDTLTTIHVAGTNGKGSVSRLISNILIQAGYRVGTFISPHLQRFNERITLDNIPISDADLVRLLTEIKEHFDTMSRQGDPPTFFELTTALAFRFFSENDLDFCVLEVGLGGRYDATNIIRPLLSIITNISLEHTRQLGTTRQQIAREKAGIIKDHVPVITAATEEALATIEETADLHRSVITIITPEQIRRIRCTTTTQEFSIHTSLQPYQITTRLLGRHQGENIALSIEAIEELRRQGYPITDHSIKEGVRTTRHPGRMETMPGMPSFLLDGAHNPAGMEKLASTLQEDIEYRHLITIISMLSDKDPAKMIQPLLPLSLRLIATQNNNTRCMPADVLSEQIKMQDSEKEIIITTDMATAIDEALTYASSEDLILITGSLYSIGEARDILFDTSKRTTQRRR